MADLYDAGEWQDDNDEFYDAEDYFVLEESAPITKEDLVEGGDYHLKSALKNEGDYLMNSVYMKERETLSKSINGLGDIVPPYSSVVYGLDLFGSVVKERRLLNQIWGVVGAFMTELFALSTHISLVATEMGLFLSNTSKDVINARLSQGSSLFNETYGELLDIIKVVLVLMVIMNNLKNIRQGTKMHDLLEKCCRLVDNIIYVTISGEVSAYISTDLIVLQRGANRRYMPKPYFLNMCDKLQERFNVLLYTCLASASLIPHAPSLLLVERILNWGDQVLAQFGNNGYELIAMYEAVCVGVILSRDDPELDPYDDEDTFLDKLLYHENYDMMEKIYALVDILHESTTHEIMDLHGLYRIWGHPVVDIEGGIKKLQSLTQLEKPDYRHSTGSLLCARSFKSIFMKNYFKKHDFYPPCEFSLNEYDYISSCIKQGIEIDEANLFYNHSHWDNVILKKAFSIPFTWNILHLAKDKAISPTRSELYQILSRTGTIFNQALRRGVLKLMETTLIPLRDFLSHVAEHGLDIDDCIIGLFPKERELKIMARFFSLMSFKMRLYFTATESLLGEKLLQYFPQITMNLNLLDMQEKMGEMSKELKNQKTKVTYVLNMDFMKWNQQMRESICDPIFKLLDDVFGMPGLYTNSHKIFKNSVLYLADGSRKLSPDPYTGLLIDDDFVWQDDGAGKEGIRQKAWTIMTVCDIDVIARKHGGSIQLVGGGDNQVLTVTYHTNIVDGQGNITQQGKEKIKEKMKNFMTDLDQHFKSRGLPLKMSETWCSTSLFMYNKFMYYNGASARSPLKIVSRLFPFSNETSMSLSSMAQCLGTSVRSVVQKDVYPSPSLLMRNLWGSMLVWIIHLCHPMLMSISRDLNEGSGEIFRNYRKREIKIRTRPITEYLMRVLYLPSHFGGPGLPNIFQLMMRGFPDPITEGICFLQSMTQALTNSRHPIANVFSRFGVSFRRPNDYAPLIEDPVSLNHDAPRNGSSEQREAAKEILLSSSFKNNTDMRNIIQLMSGASEREFYKALSSGDILDVKVLHEIASASLYAITNSLTSRIDKSATLRRMSNRVSFLKKLALSEVQYLRYLMVRDHQTHDLLFIGCSRILADRARAMSWMKEVVGVTVPFPYEYLKLSASTANLGSSGYIAARVDGADRESFFLHLGDCKIYLGTYTKDKFKMTDVASAYGDEEILTKSISLLKIVNWRYALGTRMAELLQVPIKSVSDLDPGTMIQDTMVTKGDYDHRRKVDSSVHGGIPNYIPVPSSHISICTSTWTEHAKGGKNENIHFQACLIHCQFSLIMKRFLDELATNNCHFVENCPDCIREIQEPDSASTSPKLSISFPSLVGNNFVYVSAQEVVWDYSVTEKMRKNEIMGLYSMSFDDQIDNLDAHSTMAWCVLMHVMGISSSASSFYLLNKNYIDPHLFMIYFITFWRQLREKGALFNRSLGDWSPLLTILGTEGGMDVLSNLLGVEVVGDIEGELHCDVADICEKLDLSNVTEVPPIVINLLAPMVRWQQALYWKTQFPLLSLCSNCLTEFFSVWNNKSTSRLDADIRCPKHYTGAVRPKIINVHVDRMRSYMEANYQRSVSVVLSQYNQHNKLKIIPSLIGDWPSVEVIDPIFRTGCEKDTPSRCRIALESMLLLTPDTVILGVDVSMAKFVRDAVAFMKETMADFNPVLFSLITSLAHSESDVIYERRSLLGESGVQLQEGYLVVPDGLHRLFIFPGDDMIKFISVGDWVVTTCPTMILHKDDLRPDVCFLLENDGYSWMVLMQKGSGVFQPDALIRSFREMFNHHRDRVTEAESNDIMSIIKNPMWGGGYLSLRRRCLWAVFSSRFDLLKCVERVKKFLTKPGTEERREKISRGKKEDLLVFVISLLTAAQNCNLAHLHTLSYVEINYTTVSLIPRFNKAGIMSSRLLAIFWLIRKYNEKREINFQIDYRSACKRINLVGPMPEGFNVTGV